MVRKHSLPRYCANSPEVDHIGSNESHADDEDPNKESGVVTVGRGEDCSLDTLRLTHLVAEVRDHSVISPR